MFYVEDKAPDTENVWTPCREADNPYATRKRAKAFMQRILTANYGDGTPRFPFHYALGPDYMRVVKRDKED